MYQELAFGNSDWLAIVQMFSVHVFSLAAVAFTVRTLLSRICLSSDTIHSPCNSAHDGPLQSAVGAWGPYVKNLDGVSLLATASSVAGTYMLGKLLTDMPTKVLTPLCHLSCR